MQDRALSLWEAWRDRRDGAAFASLVEPEIGRALGLARSLGCGPEDAEDAVQDALARLAGERSAEPARVGVRAWFYRAVRDRARSQSRSGWRRRRRERAASRPEVAAAAPDRLEIREQVERALLELDSDDREAVRLHHLQDLDYREMAHVLGVSEGACRVRVHRALERLKGRLGSNAAALVAALPLPATGKGAAMVKGAIAAGLSGSGAATAAATGGLVMASTVKASMIAAGVLGAGLVGTLAYTALKPGTEREGTEVANRPGAGESPTPVKGGPEAPGGTRSDAPSGPPAKPATPPVDGPIGRGGGGGAGGGGGGGRGAAGPAQGAQAGTAEARPATGGLAILEDFLAGRGNPGDLLWTFEKVNAVVRTGEGETRRVESAGEVTRVNLGDLAEKSCVVEFGPGRFQFEPQGTEASMFHVPRKDIASLEIRGAGMDRTTLDGKGLWQFLCAQGGIENLRVANLTFDGGPERVPFLDVRGSGAAILENVRFLNISNAGYAADVGTSGKIFLGMKGCEFVGSGGEWGVCIRGSALALLEKCRFSRLHGAVIGGGNPEDAAVVNLLNCLFDGSPVVDRASRKRADGTPALSVSVHGGQVLLGPPGADKEKIGEGWGASLVAESTDVSFAPGTPAYSLREMLAALDRMSLPAGEVVAGIRVHPVDSRGPEGWVVLAMETTESGRKEHHYFLPARDGPPEELPRKIQAMDPPTAEQMDGALPLAQVLRQSGLSPETGAMEASFRLSFKLGNDVVPAVYLRAPRGWPEAQLNGKTGDDLNKLLR